MDAWIEEAITREEGLTLFTTGRSGAGMRRSASGTETLTTLGRSAIEVNCYFNTDTFPAFGEREASHDWYILHIPIPIPIPKFQINKNPRRRSS